MFVVQSSQARCFEPQTEVLLAIASISSDWLRRVVQQVAIPRHFVAEPENNHQIGQWINAQLQMFGYQTRWQGACRNLMTIPPDEIRPVILVGAHYDSVPQTPGADDNGSAVAAMLACAKVVAEYSPHAGVCFVAFNREEDDLLGSKEFVESLVRNGELKVREAHILEMVGYCDTMPGSQTLPQGLPIKLIRDRGDFLAVLGNRRSTLLIDSLMCSAKSYVPACPVLGLKILFGLERYFKDLRRSDHAPFWTQGIPALMWTDTANFRNPHYHKCSDTPDTLNYEFLLSVTQVLTAHVMSNALHSP